MVSRRKQGAAGRLVRRFVLGLPLDGRRRCDGTFWRRGTRRLGPAPYVVTWQWWRMAAGWQRAVVRLAAAGVVLAVALLAWVVA